MCGICGTWQFGPPAGGNPPSIRIMTERLSHRGPDAQGIYEDEDNRVALGFRRLAIIDLSPQGNQPMSNEDGTIWIVFNGEIYNFRELRRRLVSQGHQFRSQSDTEVVIHLYEDEGLNFLRSLNGMFGMAIWDSRRRRLVLARDRVGKKPLYYAHYNGRLAFASELKALLLDQHLPRQLDHAALAQYLALGYVVSPRTIFEFVQKLQPGHLLVVESGELKLERYWDLLPAFQEPVRQPMETWISEVRALLPVVVGERLMSDVPLGAFLSGGVDSSSVVATMAQLSNMPVKTFSIGFSEPAFNELPHAREVAQRCDTDHHELIVEPEDLRELLPRLVGIFDEPFGDSSAVPTYYVSKMARDWVTVCLSGDGGDEALAGYGRYRLALSLHQLDWIPIGLRQAILGPPTAAMGRFTQKGQRMAQRLMQPFADRYADIMRSTQRHLLEGLMTAEASATLSHNGHSVIARGMAAAHHLDPLSRMQYVDVQVYLPEDILTKVDRTSMAVSLEVRCPLLDYRFLELMARVPPELRQRNGDGKLLLKAAMRGILPESVLRRDKMGFGVPLNRWFRGQLADFAAEILLDDETLRRGLWQPKGVAKLLAWHQSDRANLQAIIWTLIVLELWWRAYRPLA
ncbi:MAG: asparagine synthase (glutamine-hydrolyzing) [Candidatus Promineifilaceae bacterium]